MLAYKLPLRAAEAEFEEKRSRFIARITPVSSEGEAAAFLRAVRKEHSQADHNVYAYRLKSGGICRHSDDGEPPGTAGVPLLECFLKQDVYDFCCVATRYFGGVMLGAGGLTRAYARSGVMALEASGIGVMREVALCSAILPYALYESVKRTLNADGAKITSEEFGGEVTLVFSVAKEKLPEVQRGVAELTAGAVSVRVDGTGFAERTD